MAKPRRELESKALKLSARERARLAQRLISSLEREVDADAEKLWRQEAERRLGEIKSGKVAGIPAEKVIRKARSSLRREASSFIPKLRTSLYRQPSSTSAKRTASGSTSSLRFSTRMSACSSFLPLALRSAGGSGVFWYPSFPMVSCIASSLSELSSSLSCIFTADQPTGGPASET